MIDKDDIPRWLYPLFGVAALFAVLTDPGLLRRNQTMWVVEIFWHHKWRPLEAFATNDAAHWACAEFRQQFGRPTAQGDPFRVVNKLEEVEARKDTTGIWGA